MALVWVEECRQVGRPVLIDLDSSLALISLMYLHAETSQIVSELLTNQQINVHIV